MLVNCHLHGGFVATRLVNFPKFEEFSPHFYSKISRTEQKCNTEIAIRPLYLCLILRQFYTMKYMASFRCGNTLLKGDLKNTTTYQNISGQQVIRPLLFIQKNLTKLIYAIRYIANTRLRKHENLPKHPEQQVVSHPFLTQKDLTELTAYPIRYITSFSFVMHGTETPIGMKLNLRCGTGVVWFLETITGK